MLVKLYICTFTWVFLYTQKRTPVFTKQCPFLIFSVGLRSPLLQKKNQSINQSIILCFSMAVTSVLHFLGLHQVCSHTASFIDLSDPCPCQIKLEVQIQQPISSLFLQMDVKKQQCSLSRAQQACSVKDKMVNIFSFADHAVSIMTTSLHCCSRKAAIDNKINEHGFVSKLCIYKNTDLACRS